MLEDQRQYEIRDHKIQGDKIFDPDAEYPGLKRRLKKMEIVF